MTEPTSSSQPVPTLAEVFADFLSSLRSDKQRLEHERWVRHYIQTVGEDVDPGSITGARVEWYAEMHIKSTDPLADVRAAALKSWFQYLKRKNHTTQNFGTVIRVRRSARSRSAVVSVASDVPPLEVTEAGFAAMQAELGNLQKEVPQLVEAIALAREDKDFRENAPLDAAREALAQNESRRRQIESDLRRARVVDEGESERIGIGTKVTVTRLDNGQQFTYQLVGAREADARAGKISVESPVGAQLVGKNEGDEIAVRTPTGELSFRIDRIGKK